MDLIPITKLKKGEKAFIKEITGGPGFVARLERLGLRIGKEVRITNKGFRGPVVMKVDNTEVAVGRGMAERILVRPRIFRVLLAGNPNVGKSVVFSRLTSLDVISSNYPGTTVDYSQGTLWLGDKKLEICDVPGAYSLEPTCKAEDVACRMLNETDTDLIVNVIDATNLERNLYLTLQLLECAVPMVVVLNKWDLARQKGISIDTGRLARLLKVPVIPLVALTGEGLREVVDAIQETLHRPERRTQMPPLSYEEKWKVIGEISKDMQKVVHKHPTFLDRLAEFSTSPVTGMLLALLVLSASFYLIRLIGEGLITFVAEPLYQKVYYPSLLFLLEMLPFPELARTLLIGTSGTAMDSFGILTTGIYIPFVVVFPYIISFYFILSFLEDFGYLPRISVLADRIFHKIGLHGFATISTILGLGCKVPALLATRVLESRREKILAVALLLMIAPCMPQTAMIFSLLGRYGVRYVLLVFLILFITALSAAFFLNKVLKGIAPELIVEIPPYQLPSLSILCKKVWMRVRSFLYEAVPFIIFGVALVNVLDTLGLLEWIARIFTPVTVKLFGLPGEVTSIMILGFLRKDISIALLAPFDLSLKQLIVSCVFMVLYLPCMATSFMLFRELGLKDAIKVICLTLCTATLVSSFLYFML
ncbi:MAG: fused ferrous iron transport protein A/B [Candidatus Omnitrophica bacterium]|nr:fused ferrous iron transport protein A/B [Candidatus Omnitrophota bacterium]